MGRVMREVPGLKVLARQLRTAAKLGPKPYQAYLVSAEFDRRWDAIPPSGRRRAIQVLAAIEALAVQHDGLPPPVKPQRRNLSRWHDPKARQKLAAAYAAAGEDHEKAGRILGCTADAARLARWRHLGAPATDHVTAAA